MSTILAPAKLNLTLEVLGKRPDGFHEVRSIVQTISLCDDLHFEPGQGIQIESDSPGWVAEKSLVSQAASLLQDITGCRKGARISVTKRIPLVSGLGGDSSDAAAALRGLNRLWGLGLSTRELHHLAERLGSDVPFFLYGGTALMASRGENIIPLPPLPHMNVVLMVPNTPRPLRKTEQLYARLKPEHFTDGRITEKLVGVLREGKEFTPSLLFNTFENVVFAPSSELKVHRSHILKIGAGNVHLAGSGPALFTLLKSHAEGEDLCTRLKAQGMELYLVDTLASLPQDNF